MGKLQFLDAVKEVRRLAASAHKRLMKIEDSLVAAIGLSVGRLLVHVMTAGTFLLLLD